MKFSLGLLAIWVAMALGQAGQECTREMIKTDDCLDVINANACYNQFRFRAGKQTLQCIHGENDTERAQKARLPPEKRILLERAC
jgi:hypothetical protein